MPTPPSLRVHTRAVPDIGPLLDLVPDDPDVCAWVRRGQGLVGWGVAASTTTQGPDRFAQAERWWQRVAELADVEDTVGLPGSGAVAFGSFAFADDSPAGARLVVPRVIIGRRDSATWLTTVTPAGEPAAAATPIPTVEPAPPAPGTITYADGALPGPRWQEAVAQAVSRICAGELDKVVLARDLGVATQEPIHARWLLRRLAQGYDTTWVFSVDGLVGATPELLVRLERGLATSRVLAGTIRRTGDDEADLALAASLARSSKDLEEHEYAVRSVADALAPHCTSMSVPEAPFVLHLPNVMHLATDVAGRMRNGASSLGLASALHPSAAVCGTPRAAAQRVIGEIEHLDRGRYAGPVGWMDALGDGEWGIALRSGELDRHDPRRMRIFAGCGIVAGSDPAAELAESDAKLIPMRTALNSG